MARKVVYVVGDIHGCYKEYLSLERKIQQHAKRHSWKPYILSVGDLVDRGPQCMEVVEHFVQGAKKGTHGAVLGNHEEYFISSLFRFAEFIPGAAQWPERPWWMCPDEIRQSRRKDREHMPLREFGIQMTQHWIGQGGYETLVGYGCDPSRPNSWDIPLEHMNFFCSMPLVWQNAQVLVSHAVPNRAEWDLVERCQKNPSLVDFHDEALADAVHSCLWTRECHHGRGRVRTALHAKKYHVSGHTPFPRPWKITPERMAYVDTAAVYGNLLTAWCSETQRFLSVESETTVE